MYTMEHCPNDSLFPLTLPPPHSHQHQTNWKQVLIFNGEYKFEKQ